MDILSTAMEVLGLVALIVAAFLVSLILGIAVGGVALIAVGYALGRPVAKGGDGQ